MKIYVYTPTASNPRIEHHFSTIRDILDRAAVDVVSKDMSGEEVFPETYRQVERRGESLLDYLDAVVIEGSEPDPEVGYLLAYAVAQKKPTLLLVEKGKANQHPLKTFGQRVPKNIRVEFYHEAKLESLLLDFLRTLGEIAYQEVPSIKFTLRITPQIEHYLQWKTHNTKMTKADFLRKILLDDIIPHDEGFQRSQKKRRPHTTE